MEAAESLFECLEQVPDPRRARGVRHPFQAILRLTLLGLVCGLSRASTKHTSGAEQKCTTREVIGQRKCPRQLFGRGVTEAGWQQAGRVSE